MKTPNDEKGNFWIAYADLMAGLLFVFILLVGGIIVKYFLMQSDFFRIQDEFAAAKSDLNQTQSDLDKTQNEFLKTMAVLQSSQEKNEQLEELNRLFNERLSALNLELNETKKQNSLYILQIDDLNDMIDDLKKGNLDLKKIVESREDAISENEEKIAYLLAQISQKESDFNRILHDLNTTKNRIRNLTGIKVKVIARLSEALGSDMSIDPNSGNLRLSSSVLFDKGSSELKEEAKPEFRRTLERYFAVLLRDKNIRENLESIVIEGHTDSDGGYLYNLELSQARAQAVMEFINSWNEDADLERFLVASGRSYTMPILRDGVEDKDASRRIEIKFSISNKEAIDEIQKFLEYDANED